jgi:hypothetical protein
MNNSLDSVHNGRMFFRAIDANLMSDATWHLDALALLEYAMGV